MAASEPVHDLHATLVGDLLDMRASEPPPHLRLQGSALARVRRVRLNHREIPAPPSRQPNTLVIDGVDWPVRVLLPSDAAGRADGVLALEGSVWR